MQRLCSILAVSIIAVACGDDPSTGSNPPTPDTVAPQVSSVDPVDGSTVSVSRAITVSFNEAMRDTSVSLGGTLAADGTSEAWTDSRTLVISPATTWPVGAGLTLSLDATDTSGNALATHSLTYTVDVNLDATPPTAIILPVDAATIATAQTIVVTFSESMSTASLALGGSLALESDGGIWSVAASSNDRVTLSPSTDWSEGAHTLTVDATDVAGNPLAQLSVSYTVDAGVTVIDATPPVGVASPDGGFISPSGVIQVTYDETMDETSLSVTGTLASGATDAWNINSDILTLSPGTAWPEGVGTLTIDADDLAGNPANTIVLSLTVDTAAPT